jgi:hypothetical protein
MIINRVKSKKARAKPAQVIAVSTMNLKINTSGTEPEAPRYEAIA